MSENNVLRQENELLRNLISEKNNNTPFSNEKLDVKVILAQAQNEKIKLIEEYLNPTGLTIEELSERNAFASLCQLLDAYLLEAMPSMDEQKEQLRKELYSFRNTFCQNIDKSTIDEYIDNKFII